MFWRCRVDLYMLTAHLKRSFLFISVLHYHSKSPGGPWIYGPENASPSVNYPCVEPRGTVHWFQYVSLQGKQVHLRAVSFSKKYRVKIETTGLSEWTRATIVAISRTASMTECRKNRNMLKRLTIGNHAHDKGTSCIYSHLPHQLNVWSTHSNHESTVEVFK